MQSKNNHIILSPECALKNLETPSVYNIRKDELYELNGEAFEFLKSCYTPQDIEGVDKGFLAFCRDEGILEDYINNIKKRVPPLCSSPSPSLRYLELLLTERCNLKCKHCYLGEASAKELSFDSVVRVFEDFEKMQGLRMLLSGGEPLLHSDFWGINDILSEYTFRSVLLSNGILLNKETVSRLNVHEVQLSLDGMESSHDYIRGRGSFVKVLRAIEYLKNADIDVSIATMVLSHNRRDFSEMKKFIEKLDIKEWNIDVPCTAGYLKNNNNLLLPYHEAKEYLEYAFGGGSHGSSSGYACGSHLCAVNVERFICRCGFFKDEPVCSIESGLENGWNMLKHYLLDELDCDCQYVNDCKGGCRYRALIHNESILSPDPLYCSIYGISMKEKVKCVNQ